MVHPYLGQRIFRLSGFFGSADISAQWIFRVGGSFWSADISGWCGLDNQVHPEWPVLKGLFTG